MRHGSLSGMSKAFAKCQEIASPSLSGSVANNILSAFAASFFKLLRSGPLPRIVIYLGTNPDSISMPN